MQVAVTAISEFAAEAGKPRWEWSAEPENAALKAAMTEGFAEQVEAAYGISEKMDRYSKLDEVRSAAIDALVSEEAAVEEADVTKAFAKLEKNTVRRRVIESKPRIDGRDNKTVRPIAVEVGLLSKTHGSSLFTRGETQSIVTCTLGTSRDAQMSDGLAGENKDSFMLHYNFPPYSVGECGRMGGVGRREIGHGRLARRGVQAVLPSEEEFPYTIRIVSEITESNGSSSMASVCGASLSMMDAGVPLKAPVAGIAMGLVKEDDGFAVLTDILGDEDHLGDMDFKVAGTAEGITALQMDIKIEGINEEIMDLALSQALEARTHILREMAKVIGYARPEVSPNAPSMASIKIDPEKIRDVIGKGGATIRSITELTGASIDLDDDGTVRIYAADKASSDAALVRIHEITAEAEVDKIYKGTVARLAEFGAFVTILPGKDGLVHISQIAEERIRAVSDFLEEGQQVLVKVLDVDARGRIKLSMKDVSEEEKAAFTE
jgi:polyribonucleotide nucleotidyltransferase